MSMFMRYTASLIGVLLLAAAASPVYADPSDPPGRVARLSVTRGDVSFSPAGEDDWVTATRNRPLIRGDRLWTDRGARAELQAGTAAFRIDEGTSMQILDLDDLTAQVEITQGTLNLRVRRIYQDQTYEVDTPTLAFVISRPGEYRIDVDPRGSHTTIAVWEGGGEAYGDKANFRVREGEAIRFHDSALQDYQAFDLPRPDEFDRFCQERDESMNRSASRRYVSEDVIGYSDLDEYGSWNEVSEYGSVWFPSRVEADWAPYRDGNWIWQDPWGWTWVDDASWGFAPFHYGRWAHVNNRWGWIPGPVAVRPVYAPALVAFVGGGGWGAGISVGTNPIGWFPLGPREVYIPSYRGSRNYFNRVNVSNTIINNTYITNVYNDYSNGRRTQQVNYYNRGVAGAVTAVSSNAFVNSRPVRESLIKMDRDAAQRAEVSQIAALTPVSRSVIGSSRAATAIPQREVLNRSVIARSTPPAAQVSFADRQQALQRNPGRGFTPDAADGQRRERTNAAESARVRVIGDAAARNARTMDADTASSGRGAQPGRDAAPGRDNARAPSQLDRNREPRVNPPAADRATPDRRDAGNVRDTSGADRQRGELTRPDRDFNRPSARTTDSADGGQPRRNPVQRDVASPRESAAERPSMQRDSNRPPRGDDARREIPVQNRDQEQPRNPASDRRREAPVERPEPAERAAPVERPRRIEQSSQPQAVERAAPVERPRRVEQQRQAAQPAAPVERSAPEPRERQQPREAPVQREQPAPPPQQREAPRQRDAAPAPAAPPQRERKREEKDDDGEKTDNPRRRER
ncbi:MAG: DUF6600 domain-containing protein [Tahibacter sp.]